MGHARLNGHQPGGVVARPGEDGILLHSLSWAPLLFDYGAIGEHDTSTFDQWTLDGDYLYNNTQGLNRVHVVQDSDELFLSSWGPLAEHAISKTRFPFERYLAGHFFRQSFYSGFFDPLKPKACLFAGALAFTAVERHVACR